jgi:hypothetical protein
VFKWLTNDWRPGGSFIVMSGNNLPPALVSAVSDVATALESHFDGRLATLMLAELVPGGEIVEHRDMRPALTAVHRCHLPVVSNKDVSFVVDGHDYYLGAGHRVRVRQHAPARRTKSRRRAARSSHLRHHAG